MEKKKTSLKTKITLALLSIVAILLLSNVISIIEFSRMGTAVSDTIEDNVQTINVTQGLAASCEEYNLEILAKIGETAAEATSIYPKYDADAFRATCDSLKASLAGQAALDQTDSVVVAFNKYFEISGELRSVVENDSIDSRKWYFGRLEPKFKALNVEFGKLNSLTYTELSVNSSKFEENYYRSLFPGIVATFAGILLVLMLLYFIVTMYVNPLMRMLDNLEAYRTSTKPYKYEFQGNDELCKLNEDILEITESNAELKRRNKELKNR